MEVGVREGECRAGGCSLLEGESPGRESTERGGESLIGGREDGR